ncbi:MAG: response regulator [Alphaproteobacteria bacterium]
MNARTPEATLADLSVAVVDDDKDMLKLMRTMLQRIGLQRIALFLDPAEALALPAIKAPDVLICDWEMEAMDGGTFVERFRNTPAGRSGPAVFFLTGRPLTERVETARRLKVQGFLAKPVSPKTLKARLSKLGTGPRTSPHPLAPEERPSGPTLPGPTTPETPTPEPNAPELTAQEPRPSEIGAGDDDVVEI